MTDTILELLPSLGLPVLALVITLAAIGIPMLPASLTILVSGTLVASGDLPLAGTAATALGAAVAGDHAGYFLGQSASQRLHRADRGSMRKAQALLERRGGLAVFLTRWLIAPLGPPMNLAAGAGSMSWRGFAAWDLAGELVWVGGYLMLGAAFAPLIPQIEALSGDITALLACLTVAALAVWLLRRRQRAVSRP